MRLSQSMRRGFTLVELLVVIAIIGLLVAILLPALSSARNSAQAAGSGSNLSSFGRGFMIHSTEDKNSRLSTGAFDHLRDGDSRRIGWVADLIRVKVSNPGKALDPANPSQINEKVADYVGAANTDRANPKRWKGKTANVHFGAADGPTDMVSATAAQKFKVWEDGVNSNYATTWHFSRGDVISGSNGVINADLKMDPVPVASGGDPGKCPLDGDGPLTEKKLTGAGVSRDRVALMGAARNGDGSDASVTGAFVTAFEAYFGADQKIVKSGDILVESFTDGMNTPFEDATLGGASGEKIHEINDIVPIHGARKTLVGDRQLLTSGYAQVLFADGHVAKIVDEGGYLDGPDGWIGPYKADGNPTGTTFAINKSGYDETRELIWLEQLGNASGGVGGGGVE